VISPIAGLVLAFVLMGVLRLAVGRRDVSRTERHFRRAQLVSSAAVSLGHGATTPRRRWG
jgi:inorganic phosphate transporter, PiT family